MVGAVLTVVSQPQPWLSLLWLSELWRSRVPVSQIPMNQGARA